jgi:hypothetical protein
MYYWNDLHSIPAARKSHAISSLEELRKAHDRYQAQRKFQEERERQMHAQRIERTALSSHDHSRLQQFRDEFDAVFVMPDRQERGNRFQDLLNKILQYYSEQSLGTFSRTGEQIDATFYFDKHWYYVEIRWKGHDPNAADISVLRDRAKEAYGGDTKALFISFSGLHYGRLGEPLWQKRREGDSNGRNGSRGCLRLRHCLRCPSRRKAGRDGAEQTPFRRFTRDNRSAKRIGQGASGPTKRLSGRRIQSEGRRAPARRRKHFDDLPMTTIMGIIGRHVDTTSERRRHQAKGALER